MTSTTAIQQGTSPEEDYGLGAIAQHNAAVTSTEEFPAYRTNGKGLGIFGYQEEAFFLHNPPTPRSTTASDGVRTRSGRSTRGHTYSPSGTDKSRVSKSPARRAAKKEKKSKLDRTKTPKLTAPLSVLTKDLATPLKDMDAWVHRPAEERQREVEKRNGYVTRPMNSFMLYRSAYAERTKQWCLQNNHQVVSSVSGESWPMEPQEVRDQFNEWARVERANHQAAHPNYKFSPSKSTNKRRKGDISEDEEEASDLDAGDPDGEYRGPTGRTTRQRRLQQQQQQQQVPLNATYGFESHPYFGQANGYEHSQYQYANPGRPVPSNIAYDVSGQPFDPRTGQYIQAAATYAHQQYPYAQGVRIPTPASLHQHQQQQQQQQLQHQSIGGYGLPGGQQVSTDDLFPASRTSTPMQQYGQTSSYGQAVYPQYAHSSYASAPEQAYQQQAVLSSQQAYEHAQYLQAAANSVSQGVLDPALEAAMAEEGNGNGQPGMLPPEDHFASAIGDMTMPEYYDESTSPDAALGPVWDTTEVLK